ncbi:hypothetical protein BpHYR1_011344 [Brachionus plicatilis]|uniref:Uncharacterized protein n=1 Tax=Brachionus plicatilis TaxID=10195 RepID=A0A3M7SLY8_BRAPC|nr:hypothetical protein BpHYR1_011344 [Brachionus plicatilis]
MDSLDESVGMGDSDELTDLFGEAGSVPLVMLSFSWLSSLSSEFKLGWDSGPILLRSMRLIELTDGTLYLSQMRSCSSLSLISHANMPGSLCLYSLILPTTFGVVTRGLLPPIAPGNMLPVSW